MDISNFMTWFINQVVSMFTNLFGILEDIEFLGTNLLQVLVTILIIGTILPILLTLGYSNGGIIRDAKSYNDRVRNRNQKEYNKAEGE